MENYFTKLNSLNVSGHVEQKNGLSYLSWSWAWSELKNNYPEAIYTIYENKDGWNYFTDGKTCWVKTGITINSIEHIEYLPVMDFRNKSITLEQITSVDVNKAIQRSLTKAVARHGLGLYIYAGEDLPESEKPENKMITPEQIAALIGKVSDKTLEFFKVSKLEDMTFLQAEQAINALSKKDVVSKLQEVYPDAKINIVKA